jgi:hypothetical protein
MLNRDRGRGSGSGSGSGMDAGGVGCIGGVRKEHFWHFL